MSIKPIVEKFPEEEVQERRKKKEKLMKSKQFQKANKLKQHELLLGLHLREMFKNIV